MVGLVLFLLVFLCTVASNIHLGKKVFKKEIVM